MWSGRLASGDDCHNYDDNDDDDDDNDDNDDDDNDDNMACYNYYYDVIWATDHTAAGISPN